MLKGSIINDVEDSNEILMLNRKKKKEEKHQNKPQHDIPFKMNRPLF